MLLLYNITNIILGIIVCFSVYFNAYLEMHPFLMYIVKILTYTNGAKVLKGNSLLNDETSYNLANTIVLFSFQLEGQGI